MFLHQILQRNSFFSESVFGMKQRRAAWIPDCPQLSSLIRSLTSSQEMITYMESLLHNKTWRNTRLQLSKLSARFFIYFKWYQTIGKRSIETSTNYEENCQGWPSVGENRRYKPLLYYRLILLLYIRLWSFLTYCYYFMFLKLLSAKDKQFHVFRWRCVNFSQYCRKININ